MPGTGRNWWQVSKPHPTANTPPPENNTCNFYLKQSVCHTFIVTLKYSCIITIGTMFYVPFICTQWEFCVLSHLILTAPHSSTLAWQIPWVEEPGRLQSMGSLRVGHDWVTSLSLFTFMHWSRRWQTHSSVLAWRIPGMGEPGGLLSMGSHRVGHDWSDLAAFFFRFFSHIGYYRVLNRVPCAIQ